MTNEDEDYLVCIGDEQQQSTNQWNEKENLQRYNKYILILTG